MNFGDGDVDSHGFLAGLHFFLIAAMAKFAFYFYVSALGQLGGRFSELAPEHHALPFVERRALELPLASGREKSEWKKIIG